MARETRKVHIDVSSNVGTQMTKGTTAATGLAGAVGGVGVAAKSATFSLKSMTAALMSSGIGTIVVAIGSLVAGIGSVIGKAREFESSLSNVQSISGESAAGMEILAMNAKNLGATTAFTAKEVLDLSTELAKLGFNSKQIKAASKGILDLAAATGSELADAAVVAAGTLRGFGLDASETGRVADVMANSFSSSGLDIEKFRESMKLVAPIANTLGESLEVTTGALSVLADNQIAGSMAGTQLKRIMSDLAMKTGKSFQESLQITADKLSKATSKADQLAIAKKLVGDRAKGSLIVLAKNRDILGSLAEKYEETGVASSKAALQLDNLDGDLTKLSSAWEGFILSLEDGDGALSILFRTITQGTTAILGFFTSTDKTSDALIRQKSELSTTMVLISSLDDIISDATSSEDDLAFAQEKRREEIQKLIDQHPEHLGNLDAERVSTDKLKESLIAVNEQLINKIRLEQSEEARREQAKEQIAAEEAFQKQLEATSDKAKELRKELIANGRAGAETADSIQGIREIAESIPKSKLAYMEKGTLISLKRDMSELNALRDRMNKSVQEGLKLAQQSSVIKKETGLTTEATPEETTEKKKKVKKLNDKELEAKKSFLNKLNKLEEDTADKNNTAKIERRRERHLKELDEIKMSSKERIEAKKNIELLYEGLLTDEKAKLIKNAAKGLDELTEADKIQRKREENLRELEAIKMSETEKAALRLRINEFYDQKEKERHDETLAKFKESMAADDTEIEKINKEREKKIAELEDLEIHETEKGELRKRIKEYYDGLVDDVNAEASAKDDADTAKKIANAQKEAEEKRRLLYSTLDSAADVAGKESVIGKTLLAMKLALQLKELAMKMGFIKQELVVKGQKAMAEANIEGAKIGTATATGMAETSKVGFPWNVITMAGYALQAATLVKTFAGQKKKLASITGVTGSGASGGAAAAPSTPPSFNVLGQTSADANMIAGTVASVNDNPMRAYVVADDVTTSQGIRRNTEAMASVG